MLLLDFLFCQLRSSAVYGTAGLISYRSAPAASASFFARFAVLPLAEKYPKEKLIALAKEIAEKDIPVRKIENLSKVPEKKSVKKTRKNDIYYAEIEDGLSRKLGRKTKIVPAKKGGTITLEYYDDNDFETLLDMLELK